MLRGIIVFLRHALANAAELQLSNGCCNGIIEFK